MAIDLATVKARCGIPDAVSVYDSQVQSLVDYALFDLAESGVPAEMIETAGAPIVNAVAFFVKRDMAEDLAERERYDKLYDRAVFRLNLYEEVD